MHINRMKKWGKAQSSQQVKKAYLIKYEFLI